MTNDPHLGERVGAYRIVGLLGTGGMGDVYRAVRDDDQYHAEVAIKLMRADLHHKLAERRFLTERQILAALDHRNIARLLDGGTTAGGLPYVVMELVSGDPIDDYCDARGLPVRERVQLFLQVCAAVSYAHQHLVVHRDLKPGNIFVTADGSVKLLDFGIAKLLDPGGLPTAPADATLTQMRVMTLEYASPEQLAGGAVTTVSDVYSLGVVLYRLLTGQSPYRARDNDAQRVAEILGDTSPTRPSQLANTERHGIDSELDDILLMALRKEPAKRYGSMEQFAGDLRNYLNGMPVQARGNALRYRAYKFLRRRRIPIAAGALVLLSLIGGTGYAMREARIADEQRIVAQRHFDRVRKLSNTLLTSVFDEIAVLPGAAKLRADIAQTAQQHLDELSREPGADPLLREELAVAYRKLGDIQGGQQTPSGGDSARALESYAKSIALLEGVIAEEPGNERARVTLVKSLIMQTRGVIMTKGPQAALASTRRAVELAESGSAGYKDEFERAQVRSLAYYILGDVLMPLQQPAEAMTAYEKMVAIDEEYVALYPDNTDGLKLLRNAYNNAGIAIDSRLTAQQAFERTSGYMQKSLAITEKLLVQDPGSIEHATRLAEQRYNLADSNFNAGHYERAIELNRQAMPVLRKAAEDEGDARAQLQVALCETSLASALVRTGKLTEPAPLFNSAERTFRKLLERDPENITLRFMLAAVEIYRGEMYSRLGQWAKARASLEPGVVRMKAVNEQYPLAGGEMAVMDAGISGLAAAEAALASR